MIRAYFLVLLSLLSMYCHGPLDVQTNYHPEKGIAVPAWAKSPSLKERTTIASDTMARVWGGSSGDLNGWTEILQDEFISQSDNSIVVGLTNRDGMSIGGGGLIQIWVGTSQDCIEATDLAHEIGHVIIDDGDHLDPRWRDSVFWDHMAEELRQIVPADDTACSARLATGAGIWH